MSQQAKAGAKVVVVEPDPQLREWLKLHLLTEGFIVQATPDTERALEAVRREPPDFVILATDLPGGASFAFAAALRSSPRTTNLPLLFLVPAGDTVGSAQAMSIDPDAVLPKPLTRNMLLEAVNIRLYDSIGVTQLAVRTPNAMPRLSEVAEPAKGLLIESKEATVLQVVLRNLVTLARSLRGRTLEAILQRFFSESREVVARNGGWVVRMDATGFSALFEDGPNVDRNHCTRGIESALGTLLSARRVRQWASANLTDVFVPPLSIGCGVHTGTVIVSRISVNGSFAPSIAGQTVELAQRLDGRTKGLGWSVAASGGAAMLAGARFLYGRQASMTDTDHGTTIPIVEVLGFNPGMAKPGELGIMTETREAVLANTVLARLAGDVDPSATDKTVLFGAQRAVGEDRLPNLKDRRIARRLAQGSHVTTYVAVHVPRDREEVVKTVSLSEVPMEFANRYLEQYARLAELDQRNVASVFDVGRTDTIGYVALEWLPGGTLTEAIRRRGIPIGLALNHVAQMSLALDAFHALGMFHGALGPEHFRFRDSGVVVMADFNITARVLASLMPPGAQHAGDGAPLPDSAEGRRLDFKALGLMLCALLDAVPAGTQLTLATPAVQIEKLLRLPIELSPLRPCLDGLLGIGSTTPFDRAEGVLVELLALREVFPFDMRSEGVEGTSTLP